jgi:hypothetical protein
MGISQYDPAATGRPAWNTVSIPESYRSLATFYAGSGGSGQTALNLGGPKADFHRPPPLSAVFTVCPHH